MAINKRRLILDDHRRLGSELKAMRDRLVEIAVRLGGAYPLTDRIVIIADRTWREIDELRSALDNDVFTSYPMMQGSELMKIYYPGKNQYGDDHGQENG
jgi:hypothetical protein